MGYRIDYAGERKTEPIQRNRHFTLYWFGVFLLLVCGFWPEGRAVLRSILLPGDPENTIHAAAQLLDQLRSGETMGDAVTVFYRTVTEFG